MTIDKIRRRLLAGAACALCATALPAMAQEGVRIAAVVQSLDTEFFDGRMDPYSQASQIDTTTRSSSSRSTLTPATIRCSAPRRRASR